MTVITDKEQLKELCRGLKGEEYITVDTEFLREKTYYPKLCLIQIASQKTAFAVDPLAEGMDLSPLFEIFADEKIIKVFHSARQDIEIIINLSGKIPVPLFDTQVAAMVCGFGASASYATLVLELLGKNLDKSSRFTDWSRRPLSDKQIDYALSDVTYLRDVYVKLNDRLEKTKRESWLNEEMRELTSLETYKIDPDTVWERLKPRGGGRRFLAVVREIAKWRELQAMTLDKPRGFIIKDPVLLEIAAVAPTTQDELQSIRGVGSMKESVAKGLLDAVNTAKNLSNSDLPVNKESKKPSKASDALINMLKLLLKVKCSEFNVAEKLVATTDDLNKIALGEEDETNIFQGWRNEVFGQYALSLKKGEIALSVKNDKINIYKIGS